jgi:four helix bundle protein
MRRAAVSISSNIAEGSGRSSDREKVRFIEIAYGSMLELLSQAHLACRLGYLDKVVFDAINKQCEDVSRMLSGLRASLIPRRDIDDAV